MSAHACEFERVCPQSWNLSMASPPNPLESHPYPHPIHRGKQRPEQSSWAWGGQHPQVRGLRALASVLFLERPGQIRTRVRARLSWERTLRKAPDPFLSQMLDPRAGSGRAKGMMGNRQGPLHWAAELQGDHGRFRLTNAQECAVTPSNQPRDLQAWGPGAETQRGHPTPSSLQNLDLRPLAPESLLYSGARVDGQRLRSLQPGWLEKLFWG